MIRIILPLNSFLAFLDYDENAKALYITLRKGNQYVYSDISKTTFGSIQRAHNKGSYISINIINAKKYLCEFVKVVPMAEIEQITKPKTKYYRSFNQFLSR